MADLNEKPGEERYCHCGTHKEALAAAEKLFIQMVAADCPVWAFQIGAALRTMAVDTLKAEGMSATEVQSFGDALTRITRRDMRPATVLLEEGIKRRADLGQQR